METFLIAVNFVKTWERVLNDDSISCVCGIKQDLYDVFRYRWDLPQKAVSEITEEEINAVYFEHYWKPSFCTIVPAPLSIVVFDTAVFPSHDSNVFNLKSRPRDVCSHGSVYEPHSHQ